MNFDSILSLIQVSRNKLTILGIGPITLTVVGALGAVCFFFSMREVLGWYLRTQELRDEVRELRAEISELKHALDQAAAPILKTPESAAQLKFRLDH